jgi:hypothetical protein
MTNGKATSSACTSRLASNFFISFRSAWIVYISMLLDDNQVGQL